jgi:hypothetical protein
MELDFVFNLSLALEFAILIIGQVFFYFKLGEPAKNFWVMFWAGIALAGALILLFPAVYGFVGTMLASSSPVS